MRVWHSLADADVPEAGTSVALGVFDGLHLGHQQLLGTAVEAAGDGVTPVLVTFDPHPVEVIRPGTHPLVLTPVDRRADLAAEYGMRAVLALPFDTEMASWEPDEFVDRVLVETLSARAVTVGTNFTFGRRAAGTPDTLRELCAGRGIDCHVVDLTASDGSAVSSSRIRDHIAAGEVAAAATLLGRPHRVTGEVVHGAGRGGRDLGYPTANLLLADYTAVPADGVYAGYFTVCDDGEIDGTMEPGRRYLAAISVGTNPTFGEGERSVEAFVLDENADLYGRVGAVDFVDFVRGMEKFDGIDDLLVAMGRDVERTRAILSGE